MTTTRGLTAQGAAPARSGPLAWVRRHPLVTFFVLAYALSWFGWPLSAAFGFPMPFFPGGPLLAALIVVAVTGGRPGLRALGARMVRWRVGWGWYAAALGVPLAVHLATVALNVALGAPVPSFGHVGSVSGLLLVFAVRLIDPSDGPLGEEPGWRGYALPRLQAARAPLGATLVLAPLVAGWHLPLAFLPGFQPIELLTTVAVTFWYTWLFDHARGSALLTLLAHATEGTIQTGMFWSEGADGARMVWLYSAVWCAVALGLLVFDWNRWRARLPAAAAAAPVPIEALPGVS